jgi:two-component system CheB/CheR fusion protein
VASIVSQTLKTMDSPEAFAASIEGRIQAIAKSHNLITQAGHTGISLGAMVRTELAAYDGTGERVTVSGGDVTLTPKAGMALGMAFHELTTNAAKYGALSTLDGRLAISWSTERRKDGPSLRIEWRETVERAITRPEKSGFGTVLIERALALELDAEVKREFRSAGLYCRIDIPLTEEIANLPETSIVEDLR